MSLDRSDRRTQRTRAAVLAAFRDLVFEQRRYDQIKINDIIERANIGRSTFYEHYRNKDEVLAESIQMPFAMLAATVDQDFDIARLRAVLDHVWQNRINARSIFTGAARRAVARILARMIGARIAARHKGAEAVASPTARIAAIALADSQLAPIAAWISGELSCTSTELASVLLGIAQATTAMTDGRAPLTQPPTIGS
jgi:AcrR family transcriptional regulator